MRRTAIVFLSIWLLALAVQAPASDGSPPEAAMPRFTMEFRDADIRDVLRLMAMESGLNVIMGDDIAGRVTVSFREVTLKEALSAILKTLKYGYRVEGNILLILKEPDKPVRAMSTESLTVNYATNSRDSNDLSNLADALKPLLSGDKGSSVTVVTRTNSILVTDYPEHVERIASLVAQLDKQTPQVKIEARIVEVKDMFKDELGIQWGSNYVADTAHGNSPGFGFPNSISIGGTQTTSNYLVNLPSTNPVAGIGLHLGSIADTFNLDLRLSAMEKLEKLKILSTPSVLAVQNREAVIKVGEQLPYVKTTTDANGVSTSEVNFKDIALSLTVTPYITADNRIFMNVILNKDTRGEAVIVQDRRDFAIDTKQVNTRVLLKDGETAVIGGLYTQMKTDTDTSVPYLSKIPILGWLFRSRAANDVHNELLVFLTPKIVAGP